MTPAANTLSALLLGALVAPAGAGATTSRVIVSGLPDAGVQVATAVDEAGGQILRPLGVIDGVVAEVPRDRLDEVRRSVGVRGVVPDGTVTVSSAHDGFVAQDWAGSLPVVADVVGADRFWAQGHHGAGVDVALIDTGVSEVPGLDAGQVLHGPDLSFDSQDPSTIHVDTYGHGTHMAGIIAGRDAGAALPSAVDDDHFLGVAPAARLVSVKIGDRNGIVVVAAAGNGGHRARLSSPAYSPHVLAVGATDSMATRTTTDDEIPTWSSCDPLRNPDVVAPGRSIVSARTPVSYVAHHHPESEVTPTLARGSGTSQAAAVVSGAAALPIGQRPDITPDGVKALLTGTADSGNRPSSSNGSSSRPSGWTACSATCWTSIDSTEA